MDLVRKVRNTFPVGLTVPCGYHPVLFSQDIFSKLFIVEVEGEGCEKDDRRSLSIRSWSYYGNVHKLQQCYRARNNG